MILTLKQISIFLILLGFLGSAIVWGLKGTIPMVKETVGRGIMVEKSYYPLKLTMVLNETTFEVGEYVEITFIIENIGNGTLTLSFSDGFDRESFVVYDEAGSQVYEDIHYYPQIRIPFMLPPSLGTSLTPTWYQNLPPGSYQIVGLFISGSLNFTIETQPVTITIGL